jgi:uncharacterized protein
MMDLGFFLFVILSSCFLVGRGDKDMKRILSLDGGGAKGLIQATVLESIAQKTGKPIHNTFDLIVGTSVGSIVGGLLSSGMVSAGTLKKVMQNELPNIFKPRLRIPVLQPKYSREPIKRLFDDYVHELKMKDCETKFMCSGVDIVDGRTHFFKSWEEVDGELLLREAALRSAAAPLYFGSIVDEKNKHVWVDGGTGNMWSPGMEAFIEIMRQNWLGTDEHVHLISIGCGQASQSVPFDKAKNYHNIRQVAYYAQIVEGGLARVQMAKTESEWLTCLTTYENLNFSYQRVEELNLPKKMDKMDGIKYLKNYVDVGLKLAETVDYKHLLG